MLAVFRGNRTDVCRDTGVGCVPGDDTAFCTALSSTPASLSSRTSAVLNEVADVARTAPFTDLFDDDEVNIDCDNTRGCDDFNGICARCRLRACHARCSFNSCSNNSFR